MLVWVENVKRRIRMFILLYPIKVIRLEFIFYCRGYKSPIYPITLTFEKLKRLEIKTSSAFSVSNHGFSTIRKS